MPCRNKGTAKEIICYYPGKPWRKHVDNMVFNQSPGQRTLELRHIDAVSAVHVGAVSACWGRCQHDPPASDSGLGVPRRGQNDRRQGVENLHRSRDRVRLWIASSLFAYTPRYEVGLMALALMGPIPTKMDQTNSRVTASSRPSEQIAYFYTHHSTEARFEMATCG